MSSNITLVIERVLNRLRGALGTGETPPNSNHNFITEWYNKTVKKIGDGPWCEMTNTWAMWTGGAQSLKNGRAYTVWAAQDAEKGIRGSSWHWGTKGMKAGDQVYYDWKHVPGVKKVTTVDHTGTVEQILGDGTFHVLEGNTTGNQLRRMRRDGKFVVGYARFNWAALGLIAPTPAPKPPAKPKPDPATTKRLQSLLEVTADGKWGAVTDSRAQLMRTASRAKVGWPKRVLGSFRVVEAQRIIDTTEDGVWGPRSQASLSDWVELFQHALGVPADGDWGPRTDNAYLAARKRNLNNF